MTLIIDNLDGLGPIDYTSAIDRGGVAQLSPALGSLARPGINRAGTKPSSAQPGINQPSHAQPIKLVRTLNQPSILSGLLCLASTALLTPVRRGRIVLTSAAGTTLFTGYLATEPESIYAGVGSAGPVYRLAFSAVSDEWLLDKQPAIPTSSTGLNTAGGGVLATLIERSGGSLGTTGIAAGKFVGVFQPDAAATWSANAGALAASTYGAYRALGGAVSLATMGSVTHTLSDGDGTLSLSALRAAAVRELANDVMVSGDIEPWAYVTELFTGDGTTTIFELDQPPFVAKAGDRTLINDSFNQGVLDTSTWAISDPGSHLGLSSAGLTLTGGNGLDGETTLTAIGTVEIGGSLVLEMGSVQLSTASAGVLGGFYSGTTSIANCFAGFTVTQNVSGTVLQPLLNGSEVGTSFTVLTGHTYTLRVRIHSVEIERVAQNFYAMVDGVVTQFGGGLLTAPATVVMELIDLGASSNTPATVLYDGTAAGAVVSAPATCTLAPVDSVQLFGSIGYIRLTQTGSAWVTSTPPGTGTQTRLIGITGTGVDCKVAGSGSTNGKVTFFAGRVPVPGELITITYRSRSRAIARLENPASVAAEAAGGASGTARWLGHVLRPQARSSADCESAALAILSFATARSAAVSGSYAAINPGADIWPGDVLSLTTSGDTLNVMVRKVTLEETGAFPEVLSYTTAFANDWAEGLGIILSETIAADAILPTTALTAPATVLENLQTLTVTATSTTSLQIDAGTAPPTGGGFEVRRRDDDFGPAVDQDLVLRSPVRSFAIPRASTEERFFIRMYDASSPPLYSRCSCEVITHLAVS